MSQPSPKPSQDPRRSLTVVDTYTRESLAIESGQSLRGEDGVRVLNQLQEVRGVPQLLFCDNVRPRVYGQMMDRWVGLSRRRED
jgi:putative transposase